MRLQGTGTGEALAVTPGRLEFSAVPLGRSAELHAVVRSVGEYPVENASIRIEGGAFRTTRGNLSLGTGEELELPVQFAPQTQGPVDGLLTIESAGGSVLAEIGLGGKGGAGEFKFDPQVVDFGVQPVGRQAQRLLQVRNSSSTTLPRITGMSTEGSARASFAAEPPSLPFAPDSNHPLLVQLTFSAAAPGSFAAELVLRTDDPWQQPMRIPLVAEAIDPPTCALSIEPSTVDFGTLPAGATHERYLTIVNRQPTRCMVWGVALVDNGSGLFHLDDLPPDALFLEPGAFIRLRIGFDASSTSPTPFSAKVRFFSAGVGSVPHDTAASAWVRPVGVELTPGLLDYGSVPEGRSVVRTLTVSNQSDETHWFELPELAPGADAAFVLYPGDQLPAMLEGHSSARIRLIFAPTAAGPATARVRVPASDSRLNPLPSPLTADAWGRGIDCGDDCEWPTASCPESVETVVGAPVQVTGRPSPGTAACAWTITAEPAGSYPTLDDPQRCDTTLTTTNVGSYKLRLFTSGADGRGATCQTTVHARPPDGLWIEMAFDQPIQFCAGLLHPLAGPLDVPSSWLAGPYVRGEMPGNVPADWDTPGPADDVFFWRPTMWPTEPPMLLFMDEPSTTHSYWLEFLWFGDNRPGLQPTTNVSTTIYCGGVLLQQLQAQLFQADQGLGVGRIDFVPGGPCAYTPLNFRFTYASQ